MFADYIKIAKSISHMSIPIGVGIIIQSLYLIIDLFFVSRLGADAIAGVTSISTVTLLSCMLAQLLGIGAVSLIGQSLGTGKYAQARAIFIHAMLMAIAASVCVVVVGYMGGGRALLGLASGEAAQKMGESYLYGYMPGLALQIIVTVTTFGLRAAGEPYGPLVAQCISVPINLVLSPLLIFGVPGVAGLGTLGAGLATTLATLFAAVIILYRAVDRYRNFAQPRITFRWESIIARRIILVGLPTGLEIFVIYVYTGLMYWAAAKLGAQVQAAVGIGLMLIQAFFIPCVSVAYGCVPVAAYYFGANDIGKIKKIYIVSLAMVLSAMVCLTAGCFLWGSAIVSLFSNDRYVEVKAAYFLACTSLNFVVSGLIHINGSILQATGRTIWSLVASCTRLATFVIPLLFLADLNKITLQWLCLLSNFAFLFQAIISSCAVNLVIKRLMQITPEPVAADSPGFDTLLMNKEGREL